MTKQTAPTLAKKHLTSETLACELIAHILASKVAPSGANKAGSPVWVFGDAESPAILRLVVRQGARTGPMGLQLQAPDAPAKVAKTAKSPATGAKPKAKGKAAADNRVPKALTSAINRAAHRKALASTLGPQSTWQKGVITPQDIAVVTSAGLDPAPLLPWVAAQAKPKATPKAKAPATAPVEVVAVASAPAKPKRVRKSKTA